MQLSEKIPHVKYIPAQLHECKEWCVKYYVVNPATNQLHRKIVKVNRVKKLLKGDAGLVKLFMK
jgi:hypothetical protein